MSHNSGSATRRADQTGAAVWNGTQLLEAFDFASTWLHRHRDHINALNVFPVPDGDTGTNMSLTMQGALQAAKSAFEGATPTAADAASRLSYGALMGARGNSGVILSQIARGLAVGFADRDEIGGDDFARALGSARDMAYKAVMRPVEGTMLTVIRAAAERAEQTAQRTPSMTAVLREALGGAENALDETPNQLDILRQAGVVDAGGQGIVYLLEGLYRFATSDTDIDAAPDLPDADAIGADMAFLDSIDELHGEDAFGYCTNFMVLGSGMNFEKTRDDLSAMGTSAVIVGDETMIKVHIHTEHPGEALEYGLALGTLDQIKIDNMSAQTEALSEQRDAAIANSSAMDRAHEAAPEIHGDKAIVAVAAGEGLADALRSMGATYIVHGGQTMNPSTQELLRAVEAQPVDNVLLLPNNKNINLAAQQVAELSEKTVSIIPSKSIPEGLAALTTFSAGQSLQKNAEAMTSAMSYVSALELTEAVRDAEINGIKATTGQIIGLIDDELVHAGNTLVEVTRETLLIVDHGDAELVTIFRGEEGTEDEAAELATILEEHFPDAEIEDYYGGQPHYRFIISIE